MALSDRLILWKDLSFVTTLSFRFLFCEVGITTQKASHLWHLKQMLINYTYKPCVIFQYLKENELL